MATDSNTIYMAPYDSHVIYRYYVKEDVWSEYQHRCPKRDFGLVVFGNKLTAVGGRDESGRVTGNVLTLRQGEWIEELPPLTQPRSSPAVVSTDSHILAIGGHTGYNSVELLHRGDQAWTSLTSLPTTTTRPSAILIGEHIYIMANGKHSFFSSLTDILANLPALKWQSLPSLPPTVKYDPVTPSSCSLGGQLVIVDSDGTIYQLLHGKWEKCGHLSGTGRYRSFSILASPSTHTVVAVGGGRCDIVDVCIIV